MVADLTMASCIICFDTFNKSTRAPSTCPYCQIQICRTCLQTYLLTDISDVPKCVNTDCKHGWEREWLDTQFTRSFRLTTYKEHREKILADRETARMPATMPDAARYKAALVTCATIGKPLEEVQKKIAALRTEEAALERTLYEARYLVKSGGRERPTYTRAGEEVKKDKETPLAFIKPCPAADCKGFLSTAWKCGLCNLWSCPDCQELKGPNKECEHTCDADKVASARMIMAESKPCPKCGVRISKIDGCDQMWCTACNTAFNWRSGRIAEGPVHNPHYFAWLTSQGRNPAAAPPANVMVNCQADEDRRLMTALDINPLLGYIPQPRAMTPAAGADVTKTYIIAAWRRLRELDDPYADRHNNSMEENFRTLRIRYMANEIAADEWKGALQRYEKDVHFRRAVTNVNRTFVDAAKDILRGLLQPVHNKEDIAKQLEELRLFCNKAYADVTTRFGRKTEKLSFGSPVAPVAARVAPVAVTTAPVETPAPALAP